MTSVREQLPSTDPRVRQANWALVVIVLLYGAGLSLTKLISTSPLVAVTVRMWLAAPILLLITLSRHARIDRRTFGFAFIGGMLVTANLLFAFVAVHRTSVATVAVIQAMQPGVVLVAATPLLGERANASTILWTIVGAGGATVVVLGGAHELQGDLLGLLAAVASMFAFVGFTMMNRWARSRTQVDPVTWMTAVTMGGAIVLAPIALLGSSVADFREIGLADLLCIAFLAIPVAVFGHTLLAWAQRFMHAVRSSLVLLGVNVVATIVAWPINGERVTWTQVAGGAVVTAAIYAVISRRPAPLRAVI
jgi:drug/metabolite transporter (DMT)-like permease